MDPLERLQKSVAGRYAIECEIGRGGMAAVYLAEDLKHHRQVAIKLLAPELAAALGAERFLREIEIAARLQHPHILPLHDSGEAGGLLYYVMPYVQGESLRDRLVREPQLPLEEALGIACEVADGLQHAHDQGIVHRDIKPENLLLAGGHVLVADFGIARAVSAAGGSSLTQSGITVGTPLYMSPEQAVGSGALDRRSDQYSLACVLYEMLAGQPPFVGATSESLAHQHLSVAPRPVTALRPSVPEPVSNAIQRALAKSPADRYPSVAEFAAALSAPAPATTPVLRRGRWRSWAGAAVAITAALAVLVAINPRGWRDRLLLRGVASGAPIHSLAVLPLANLSGDPSQDFFADGMTDELTTTLARVSSLRVISRTSAMRYKGTQKSMRNIGRELGVDGVIEGSVLRSGNRVRVTAQLIRAATDQHVWAESYNRDLQDVLILQADLARAIAEQIRAKLTPAEQNRLASAAPVDPELHQLYLRARYLWNRRTDPDIKTAADLLEQAIAKDPHNALVYSALADCYVVRGGPPDSLRRLLDRARSYAEKALEIDPELAEPHAVIGLVAELYWDLETAEREFKRAIELNTNYGTAHQWYAGYLRFRGRLAENEVELGRALTLDPLSPAFRFNLALTHYNLRKYDLAAQENRRLAELYPGWLWPQDLFWKIRAVQGDWAGARTAEIETFRLAGESANAARVRSLPTPRNRQEYFQQHLEFTLAAWRNRSTAVRMFQVPAAYAAAGDRDRAFEWLEKTARSRPTPMPELVDPWFDSLRTDPRYAAYCRRTGLGPLEQ